MEKPPQKNLRITDNTQQGPVHQGRWNQYGLERIREIDEHPERFVISECPIRFKAFYHELMRVIDPVPNKHILELGSGRGEFAVWLAQQGAMVTAVDIGKNLVTAAQRLAKVNRVNCIFQQGNIIALSFDNETFDLVIGLAVLHHLSEANVKKTLRECHRVLKPGGIAVFHETVENSRVFNVIQNLFPAGKRGTRYYRPSLLCRKAWKHYVQTMDDRVMTSREFIHSARGLFHTTTITPYGLMVRLTRMIGNQQRSRLQALDRVLFKICPPLKHFSQTVLVTYQKSVTPSKTCTGPVNSIT
jgi:2-polyprenyl-3-methyl-5-hydroxy-6-metoxy-1,4-benzoquinol methylase